MSQFIEHIVTLVHFIGIYVVYENHYYSMINQLYHLQLLIGNYFDLRL